jgi:hypothetical protein
VGIGRYDLAGWYLWILVWFQTAASIVYAYLRLEQRELPNIPARKQMWSMGMRAFAYTTFNLVAVLALGLVNALPRFLFLAYFVQWSETLWGIYHPAIKWKPSRIGMRQLNVSILWTILFIVTWRL